MPAASGSTRCTQRARLERAVPTWEVLHEEFEQLHGKSVETLDPTETAAIMLEIGPTLVGCSATERVERIAKATNEATYRKRVHALPSAGQTALCLSGGGIRSAAFCLGVLQGLARRKLLNEFHYLSTVSGGGYIGSWLAAWVHRAAKAENIVPSFDDNLAPPIEHGLNEAERHQAKLARESLERVEARLSHPADLTATVAAPLQELRRKQQYISPRAGPLSPDTWAAFALLQRDLVLNWLVFIPLIVAVLLLPRVVEWLLLWWGYFARGPAAGGTEGGSGFGAVFTMIYAAVWTRDWSDVPPWPAVPGLLDFGGAILVLIGITRAICHRMTREPSSFDDAQYLRRVMLPVVGGALLLVVFLAPLIISSSPPDGFLLAEWIAGTLLTYVLARLLSAWRRGPRLKEDASSGSWDRAGWNNLLVEGIALAGAGAIAGASIWCALWLRVWMDLNATLGLRDIAAFGVPVLLLAYLMGQTIYAGLTSHSHYSPSDREWLARASGYHLLWAILWAIGGSLILFGPDLIAFSHAMLLAGGTGALTLSAAVSRFAKATTALSATKERFPVTKLTQAACLVFVAAGSVVLSHITVLALGWMGLADLEGGATVASTMQASLPSFTAEASAQAEHIAGQGFLVSLAAALVCFLFSVGVSFFVNVNTFSLHALYEARLVRTFLGASNVAEVVGAKPVRNAFTDFCDSDDIKLSDLARPKGSRLFPVLGMALNLVRADNLAWQQRKAASFVATPFRMGSDQVGYRRPDEAMKLGTAMAISGAAASPNWGYHSSPLVGFVMMLFNIRLGQWLPNPAHRPLGMKMRSFRLMLQEATGQTTDTQASVYISDGGHFDNLGVYEMLRRRCRLILVIDASQDERMTFEDLGSTLRKAAIDLGVTVEFGPLGMMRRSDPLAPGLYAGIGRIRYPEGRTLRDGWRRARGTIIYIKPGAYADVPADVRAYAASNAAFPHDSTANQFFSEAQFESYRTLGSHVVGRVFGRNDTMSIAQLPIRAARYIHAAVKAGAK